MTPRRARVQRARGSCFPKFHANICCPMHACMLAGWVPPSLHTWIKEWHRSKSAPDIFQPLDHIRNAFIRSPRTNHADPHFQIPISELTCKSSNRLIKVRSTPFSTFLPFVFYFLRSTSGTISTVIATHKGHQFKFQIWS